jgi:anti-anti-sigma regulatory factor
MWASSRIFFRKETTMDSTNHPPPRVEQRGNVKIITLTRDTVRDIENVLAGELEGPTKEVGGHLLLDFTNVECLSSVELETLITLQRKLKASGGRLTVFNLSAQVFEVFAVARLQTYLGICREEAPVSHNGDQTVDNPLGRRSGA